MCNHLRTPQVQTELQGDRTQLLEQLAVVRAQAAGAVEGVYGPDSIMWQVFRERAILLSVPAAVVMQIVHPALATAGCQHSNYKGDLLGRARRTLAAMDALIFGDLATALRTTRRIHNIHTRVRGVVAGDTASPWAGQPYRANQPELLLWVWATLIDPITRLFTLLVRPLTLVEQRQFYEEWKLTAALVGIPRELVPPTLELYQAYYQAMLTDPTLALGQSGQAIVHHLLNAPYLPGSLIKPLIAGLLSPQWRDAIGLPWTEQEQKRFMHMMTLLRLALPYAPAPVRFASAYRQANQRIRKASQHLLNRLSLYGWPLGVR